jgi:2-aminophenol/2-amino-5-chlorophenol 1,6-dioxygenase alpha subunit
MNAEVQQTPSISAQEGFSPLVPLSLLVPGVPHPLLAPEMSPAASRLRQGFERAAQKVAEVFEANQADMLLILSTQWPSILGHQMQAAERLQWEHVDPEFHELGSHRYDFGFDGAFADAYVACAQKRGLHARSIRYQGFPVDTGTVVARELLDPKGRWPVAAVSCNIYADRAEMIVLGKAAADALHQTGRRAVAVMISGLSHRMIPRRVDPSSDRIATERDHEWNQKLLEILSQGRLEDVAQLARNFAKEARADQKFKAIWWLSGLNGEHNNFTGDVLAYEPVQGTGAAVVTLTPNEHQAALVEFDEDQVEVFRGERKVLN